MQVCKGANIKKRLKSSLAVANTSLQFELVLTKRKSEVALRRNGIHSVTERKSKCSSRWDGRALETFQGLSAITAKDFQRCSTNRSLIAFVTRSQQPTSQLFFFFLLFLPLSLQ